MRLFLGVVKEIVVRAHSFYAVVEAAPTVVENPDSNGFSLSPAPFLGVDLKPRDNTRLTGRQGTRTIEVVVEPGSVSGVVMTVGLS